MFYLIRGTSKAKIKYIMQLLERNGFQVKETKYPEYIITARDPSDIIPDDYKNNLHIQQLNEDFQSMIKEHGIINDMVDAPQEFDFGSFVEVINGEYRDFKGRVIRNGNRSCDVEINVWGKIIKSTIKHSDLKAVETPFTSD